VEAAAARVEAGGLEPAEAHALGVAARAARRPGGGGGWGDAAWARGHLASARRGVLSRLLFSLVREGLLGEGVAAGASDGGADGTSDGAQGPGDRAPPPFGTPPPEPALPVRALSWRLPDGARLAVRGVGRGEFGRPLRLLDARWSPAGGGAPVPLLHPLGLWVRARPYAERAPGGPLEEARAVRFAAELADSVAQLALGLARASVRREGWVRAGASGLGAWEARLAQGGASRRQALEGWLVTGHAVHPDTKTRTGFSVADALRSVPELCEAPLPLHLFALRRELAQASGEDTDGHLAALWPAEVAAARAELSRAGLPAGDYLLLPVHPWQARHRLRPLFADLAAARALVPLAPRLLARPQASLRTLEPALAPGRGPAPLHLKVALGVQTTSAERTISPQSVHNGPRISALLTRLCAEPLPAHLAPASAGGGSATLGATLSLAREVGGAGLDPERVPDGAARARHLALLLRDSPDVLPAAPLSGRRHWLAAALPQRSPFSLRSLAAELVLDAARLGGLSAEAAAQAFFACYCRTLLTPTVWLLGRYGLALEAHGQNSWVDLDASGLPVHLTVRDFGGLRLFRPRLVAEGFPLTLYPGSAPDADSPEEVASKVSHTVLQSHLADLLDALAQDLPGALPRPWETVREVLGEVCAALGPEHGPRTLAALTAPRTRAKCLTRMRLVGQYNKYLYAEVDTPFAPPPGGIAGPSGRP
jgi:siderophore synthetase component